MAIYTIDTLVQIVNGFPWIDPGRLRSQITILQQANDPAAYDASGPAVTWQPFVTALGAFETTRGTDRNSSGQITSTLFLTVGMFYQAGILPNMRVRNENNGNVYVIQTVENVREMNQVLLLVCVGLGAND